MYKSNCQNKNVKKPTSKKSFMKHFGFKKKVYSSVQYIGIIYLRIFVHEGDLQHNLRITKF